MQNFWGTLPSWLSAGFLATLAGIATRIWLGGRQMTVTEDDSESARLIAGRKIDTESYGVLIERLTARMTATENEADRSATEAREARNKAEEASLVAERTKRIVYVMHSGMRLLMREVERLDPNSTVPQQVRDMLASTYPAIEELPGDISDLVARLP